MADLLKKLFFDDVQTKNWPKLVFFGPPSQSIGRGRISREGALDVRESREQRDKTSPEKTERQNFGSETTIFNGEFSFFCRGKTNFFGRGGITSKLASQ